MWSVIKKNPISTFAVMLVAAIGGFLAYMSIWQTTILTSPDWCNRAMKAEQLDNGSRLDAALACVGLQKVQLEAVAIDSHIDHGAFALVLVVLIVVVIAGARASWKLSTTGIEGSVGREAAAQHVVEGAKDAAAEVSDTITIPGSDVISAKSNPEGTAQ